MSYFFFHTIATSADVERFDVSVELARGYLGIPHDGVFFADEFVNAFIRVSEPATGRDRNTTRITATVSIMSTDKSFYRVLLSENQFENLPARTSDGHFETWHLCNFFLPGTDTLSEGKYILHFDIQNVAQSNLRIVVEREINIVPAGTIGANLLAFAMVHTNIKEAKGSDVLHQQAPIFTLGSTYTPALLYRFSEACHENDDFIAMVTILRYDDKMIVNAAQQMPVPKNGETGFLWLPLSAPGKFKIRIDGLDKKNEKKFYYELPYVVVDEIQLLDFLGRRELQASLMMGKSPEPVIDLMLTKGVYTMEPLDKVLPGERFTAVLCIHNLPIQDFREEPYFTPRISISLFGGDLRYDYLKEHMARPKFSGISPDTKTAFVRLLGPVDIPGNEVLPPGKYSLEIEVVRTEDETKRGTSMPIEILPANTIGILTAAFFEMGSVIAPLHMEKDKDRIFYKPPVFTAKGNNRVFFLTTINTGNLKAENVAVYVEQLDLEGKTVSEFPVDFPVSIQPRPNRISALIPVMTAIPGKYKIRVVVEDRTTGQQNISDFPLIVLDAEKELSFISQEY